jgi:hypothetical protein
VQRAAFLNKTSNATDLGLAGSRLRGKEAVRPNILWTVVREVVRICIYGGETAVLDIVVSV